MKKTERHYRVITPDYFANIDSFDPCKHGGKTGFLKSVDDAKEVIRVWGQCDKYEYKEYWKQSANECRIVKVTTTIEDILIN